MTINNSATALAAAREDAKEKAQANDSLSGPTPAQERLLGVAARLYQPFDPVCIPRLANEGGWSVSYVRDLIQELRHKGIWPYASTRGRPVSTATNGTPTPAPPPGGTPGTSPREQQILDTCIRLGLQPGDRISPASLAAPVGILPARISQIMTSLRHKGLWPYTSCGIGVRSIICPPPSPELAATSPLPLDPARIANHDPNADAELLVVQRVLAQLRRLPTPAAIQRVLAYLTDRLTKEEIPVGKEAHP